MKAIQCLTWCNPEQLQFNELPNPEVKPGHVKIAVRACGVNFADTLIIQGKYQVKPPLPFSPGAEVAGEITACGDGVGDLSVGDRVMAVLSYGGYAEEVVVPTNAVVVLPDGMDFISAAGFPVAYGTSHIALTQRGHLQPHETLLVHGASGGVGLTAVAIGKQLGALVIATASSDEKLAVAAQHGADHVFLSTADWRESVKALGGADVVYDPVGGDLFDLSLRCLKWEGRLLVIGFASGKIPQVPANILMVKNVAVIGVHWPPYLQHNPTIMRNSLHQLLQWYAAGALKPHISQTFPLAHASHALTALLNRQVTGKIVLLP